IRPIAAGTAISSTSRSDQSMVAVPAAIGLIVLAEPLVATIFYGGAFTPQDVAMTGVALQAFSIGLVGFSLVKILAPAYFAREDTRTPVRIGLIALGVNFVLSVALAWLLTRAGYAAPHAGLALAISVAALLNAALLYRGLRRDAVIRREPGWSRYGGQLLVGNIVMVIVLLQFHRSIDWWLDATITVRAGWLAISIAAAIAAYFVALLIAGVRPSTLKLQKA
ncbi:MAG: lipid II flippase MurJ, partial [Pseudomonadota bacterium]